MKYIFDSSFLISLYLEDDINHDNAINIFLWLNEDDNFYINELILIELITVITYKKWFSKVKEIKSIINELNTIIINSWYLEYINYFEYLEKKISVADCSVIYDSIKYNCMILSYDKQLLKISK